MDVDAVGVRCFRTNRMKRSNVPEKKCVCRRAIDSFALLAFQSAVFAFDVDFEAGVGE